MGRVDSSSGPEMKNAPFGLVTGASGTLAHAHFPSTSELQPAGDQPKSARLERIWNLANSTGRLARFVVFGSFVTDAPDPRDVDVILLMDDTFDSTTATGETAILFDHAAADAHFGASIFWMRRLSTFGSEDAMIGQWQIKRDGGLRGIVEITGA